MPRPKVLASVDGDRSLFGDAGANAVGAFDRFGPHAAEPSSPIFKSARIVIVAAVLDCDARSVTEEKGIPGRANHLVQAVDFPLGAESELIGRVPKIFEVWGGGKGGRTLLVGVLAQSVAQRRHACAIT